MDRILNAHHFLPAMLKRYWHPHQQPLDNAFQQLDVHRFRSSIAQQTHWRNNSKAQHPKYPEIFHCISNRIEKIIVKMKNTLHSFNASGYCFCCMNSLASFSATFDCFILSCLNIYTEYINQY